MITIICAHCKKTSFVEDDRQRTTLMCPKCGETLFVPSMEELKAPSIDDRDYRAIVISGRLLCLGWAGMTVANIAFQYLANADMSPFFPFLEDHKNRLASLVYVIATGLIGIVIGWKFQSLQAMSALVLQGWLVVTYVFTILYLVLGLAIYGRWGLLMTAGWAIVLIPNSMCLWLYEKNKTTFQ